MPDYGHAHRKERLRVQAIVQREGYVCTRCHRYQPPGAAFDLDHDDHDPTRWLGPACPTCNRGAGGRKARAKQRLIRSTPWRSRNW